MNFCTFEDALGLNFNDESLFAAIWYNPRHVLYQLLPPPTHVL